MQLICFLCNMYYSMQRQFLVNFKGTVCMSFKCANAFQEPQFKLLLKLSSSMFCLALYVWSIDIDYAVFYSILAFLLRIDTICIFKLSVT